MKFKIFFLVALICTVLTAGCLDSNQNTTDPINPLNKKIEPFESSYPKNAPTGDEIIYYKPWTNTSTIGYSNETLLTESDIVLYGTLKRIDPSAWSTADRNPPSPILNLPDHEVSYHGCDDSIYTTIILEVNDMVKGEVKGENTTEVTVVIQSGQAGNYIAIDSYYPTVWDLEIGQQYLVYLKNYEGWYPGMGDDTILMIMYPGLFVVK